MANVKEVIKSLADTDWGKDNEAQMKAVQLLKGLALSEEPASNAFMKGLSDASTAIAKTILAHSEGKKDEKEDKNESYSINYANNLLEGMADVGEVPTHINSVKVSEVANKASSLL